MKKTSGMILVCLALVAGAQPQMKANTFNTLPYRIYVPEGLATGQTVPLVLFLHGAGERGSDNEAQLKHGVKTIINYSVRTKQPMILLAPQCPRESWWTGRRNQTQNPMSLVFGLVEETIKTRPVDTNRIYITGLSMGGYGTWSAIAKKPDSFAAAIPICGGGTVSDAGKLTSVPVWAFHGSKDSTVRPEASRVMIEAIRKAGGWPRYTEYPGVQHNSWTQTYADDLVLDWLFSQKLTQRNQWESLFNGEDLTGWTPKIKGYDLGVNYGNTFRVEDGLLKVSYDQYEKFENRYGHLFFKDALSKYILRVEYRFVGEQVPGGAGWALRNSGIMIHGQPAATMSKNQDFPVSIEVQMLGGNDTNPRPTGNLCTPGTHVVMDGKLIKRHVINSNSETYHGEQWVNLEVEANGSECIKHLVNGRMVLIYKDPQLDPGDANTKKLIKHGELSLGRGSISLQSESHPVEFRRIELLRL